ncbi:MAG: GDP-mannose 4,6-dehydratase [Anaerolineae bacterium]|nr:GDP-mannose 4,6-dehydratase [Anaerolineae bacterium]
MQALITGGAGFIGSHLAESLLADGAGVTVVDNLSTGYLKNVQHLLDHPRFRMVVETVTNEIVMDRLVAESDVVFHLAAAVGVELIVQDPVRVIETNVLGTRAVLKAAARYRRRVLLASTSEIYGKSEAIPFSEEADRVLGPTTKSRWCYSTSKAVDEFLALAYHQQIGLPVVICRFFNTVGPRQTGQYGMVVPRFVKQALREEPITVYGDGLQTRCFCDVRDTVRAVRTLAARTDINGEVFNVGATYEVSIVKLAECILEAVQRRGPGAQHRGKDRIQFISYAEAYGKGFEDMRRRAPDIRKINTLTGWQPEIPLKDTIEYILEDHLHGKAFTD